MSRKKTNYSCRKTSAPKGSNFSKPETNMLQKLVSFVNHQNLWPTPGCCKKTSRLEIKSIYCVFRKKINERLWIFWIAIFCAKTTDAFSSHLFPVLRVAIADFSFAACLTYLKLHLGLCELYYYQY